LNAHVEGLARLGVAFVFHVAIVLGSAKTIGTIFEAKTVRPEFVSACETDLCGPEERLCPCHISNKLGLDLVAF
jgi:hypothetical protein